MPPSPLTSPEPVRSAYWGTGVEGSCESQPVTAHICFGRQKNSYGLQGFGGKPSVDQCHGISVQRRLCFQNL